MELTSVLFDEGLKPDDPPPEAQAPVDVSTPGLPSAALIADATDETVERLIVDAVGALVRASERPLYEVVTSLPRGYQVVYTTHILESEVANGGFLQYFYNASGQLAEEALASLLRIGAAAHAAILDAAMEQLLSEADTLAPLWNPRTLEGFFSSYQVSTVPEFDKRWYAFDPPVRQRLAYIRANVDDFESPSPFA